MSFYLRRHVFRICLLMECNFERSRQAEENTDAMLDDKSKSTRNAKSQEEVDKTVDICK